MDALRRAAEAAPPTVPNTWVRAAMLVLSFGAMCAELAISAAALGLVRSPTSPLLAQLVVSGVLMAAAAALYRCGGRDPTFLLLVVSTAAMGPFGALGAGLAAALRWLFALHATPFDRWYAALFPTLEISPTQALYERIALRGGGPDARSSVAPFSDVMALGTLQQKQAVITMIADKFRPSFAPALRSALNDPEPAVRVQAATASARIENRFLQQAMALEERRAAAPDDPDLLLTLAQYHDAYANTGLLDTARAQGERRQALDCLEHVARLRPGTPGVRQAMGRLLLRLNQPGRALEHLEALAMETAASSEVLGWYMECLYQLGRSEPLRRAAQRHGALIAASALPYEVREAIRLWSEGVADEMPATMAAA